jgi:hypothetical protein
MKDFKNINEVKIGDMVFDTYNEFGKKDFEFIEGQSFNLDNCMCEIINKTHDSVCVKIKKHPLRYYKHDGGRLSDGIECEQWFKFKREHDYEIGFPFRFKYVPAQ